MKTKSVRETRAMLRICQAGSRDIATGRVITHDESRRRVAKMLRDLERVRRVRSSH